MGTVRPPPPPQARRQLNWNGGHGTQYIVLSELLSDQAAFITSPKASLANYWGGIVPPAPQCLRACPHIVAGVTAAYCA